MATVMEGVDQRTKLVGHNRLELLLFRLAGRQQYGINVFKVQEVIQCPYLTHLPNAHSVVRGIDNVRGKTIAVIDLGMSIGEAPIEDVGKSFVIVTEYNRTVQGFLVHHVERIINLNWQEIVTPPNGSGNNNYLTAVTRVGNELVEIIDVEKVLAAQGKLDITSDALASNQAMEKKILVVDDSSVARNQIKRTVTKMGLQCLIAMDGQQALNLLHELLDTGVPITDQISMIVADIEMPNMDGYTLTTNIKKDPRLKDLYILLHTSLSGVFNRNMIEKVGADAFVPKFDPDDLALAIMKRLESV